MEINESVLVNDLVVTLIGKYKGQTLTVTKVKDRFNGEIFCKLPKRVYLGGDPTKYIEEGLYFRNELEFYK